MTVPQFVLIALSGAATCLLPGLARAEPTPGATVWWSKGPAIHTCDARVTRYEPRDGYEAICELVVLGPCPMTLAQCLNSASYVGESEEPADTLGCENKPRPRRLVVDCIDVTGVSGQYVL